MYIYIKIRRLPLVGTTRHVHMYTYTCLSLYKKAMATQLAAGWGHAGRSSYTAQNQSETDTKQ